MLTPVDELSDCVTPAVLFIEPKLDGQPGRVLSARHGQRSAITITGETRDVELGLRLEAPGDQDCVVLVTFRDSKLRR